MSDDAIPKLFNMRILIKIPNGSVYALPVIRVAQHRSQHYAHEYGGENLLSLRDDTAPLFVESDFEIIDWFQNNMDATDFYPDDWETVTEKQLSAQDILNIGKFKVETLKGGE